MSNDHDCHRCTRAVLLTLCLALICMSVGVYAFAAERVVRVKVAFCPLEGFFEYDSNGKEVGYGVDFLNELSKYANIEWEYVPVDSWEDIHGMLERGEVDVQMPVSAMINPELSDVSITTESVLPTYHAIMTLKGRNDLYYQDYDAFNSLKIAITEEMLGKTGLQDYLDSIGVTDNLEFFGDYNSCRKALSEGRVDALISNVMDLSGDMKVLDKFIVTDCYISTLKDAPCYRIINNALTELVLEDSSFKAELYEKYYADRAATPFTRAEAEYIAATDHLTVAIREDRMPVSYYDASTDSYKGIAIDIADEISRRLGIPFVYIPITTDDPRDMLDIADLVMPVIGTNGNQNLFVTRGILDSEILMAVPNGKSLPEKGARIGVVDSTSGIHDRLAEQAYYTIVEYESSAEGLRALKNGEIAGFANASYVINWMLENPRYEGLRALQYQTLPLEYQICGKVTDEYLQSALTKAIISVPDSIESQAIIQNTSYSFANMSAADKLYAYRKELITLGAAFLIIVSVAVLYNRTRTKYIAEIEQKSRDQEKANHAKSDFLARMSHDLRTPMNGILGLAELMKDETHDPALSRDISQLEMTGKYLLQLINDTLDVSKIEAGKMDLHIRPIDSEEVFKTILANASLLARTKGVNFSVHTPEIGHGKWVPVMADAARLQQIMMNLLSNAVKFTPAGGSVEVVMETISVTPDTVTDRYIIRVNGIGMSEEYLPHIFEPFSQEGRPGEGREGGTGLGMPIVKQLVAMMNGEISIKSKPGEGTEVTVLLRYPVADEQVSRAEAPAAEDTLLRGKRVLLCEDHPLNAQIATRLLEKKGVQVELAQNGKIGVEKFAASENGHYDAILMDIRMPEMNGLEAAAAIRALDRPDAAGVPIIAMTANAYDDDVQKSIDCGMNAHLAKPVEPSALYSTLVRYISPGKS